jgi:hypothetical protein
MQQTNNSLNRCYDSVLTTNTHLEENCPSSMYKIEWRVVTACEAVASWRADVSVTFVAPFDL